MLRAIRAAAEQERVQEECLRTFPPVTDRDLPPDAAHELAFALKPHEDFRVALLTLRRAVLAEILRLAAPVLKLKT